MTQSPADYIYKSRTTVGFLASKMASGSTRCNMFPLVVALSFFVLNLYVEQKQLIWI